MVLRLPPVQRKTSGESSFQSERDGIGKSFFCPFPFLRLRKLLFGAEYTDGQISCQGNLIPPSFSALRPGLCAPSFFYSQSSWGSHVLSLSSQSSALSPQSRFLLFSLSRFTVFYGVQYCNCGNIHYLPNPIEKIFDFRLRAEILAWLLPHTEESFLFDSLPPLWRRSLRIQAAKWPDRKHSGFSEQKEGDR